jgi:hypothetical protein
LFGSNLCFPIHLKQDKPSCPWFVPIMRWRCLGALWLCQQDCC